MYVVAWGWYVRLLEAFNQTNLLSCMENQEMGMEVTTQKPVPTSTELELLRALWRTEPATVRQVHDEFNRLHPCAYTTTLKMLQIMHEKGLVSRDESARAHVYSACYSEQQTQTKMVNDFVSKAFGGSRFDLVVRALGDMSTDEELAEIRQLLDSLERK